MTSDDKFASRKFVLACAAFVSGVVLLAFKLITSDQWASYTTWILGLYYGANVADTYVDRS